MKSQHKIVLASQSPRRKELLANAGIQAIIEPSPYEELPDNSLTGRELASTHAKGKARAVAEMHDSGIIIGVDTLVEVNDIILEKPTDEAHAFETIKLQQGNDVEVISAMTMINLDTNEEFSELETTIVSFHSMTDEEIKWYISTGEWIDKSGGFAIQGIGSRYIQKVNGDFLSVVGLPVQKIYEQLKKWGYATGN